MIFVLLAFIYFMAFDLEWGFNKTSLTWGLPIALALTGVAVSVIVMLKKNPVYGALGIGIGIIAIGYSVILLNSYSFVLLPRYTVQEDVMSEEDKVLSLILSAKFIDSKYTVIAPDTVMPGTRAYALTGIKAELLERGYNADNLSQKLYEINSQSIRLKIRSSVEDGYYIDYSDNFARYISKAGGGWLRWELFHPQVSGYTHISYPAFDPETGYVLIYIHQRFNSRKPYSTSGIEAYRYFDGKLEYIGTTLTTLPEYSLVQHR